MSSDYGNLSMKGLTKFGYLYVILTAGELLPSVRFLYNALWTIARNISGDLISLKNVYYVNNK